MRIDDRITLERIIDIIYQMTIIFMHRSYLYKSWLDDKTNDGIDDPKEVKREKIINPLIVHKEIDTDRWVNQQEKMWVIDNIRKNDAVRPWHYL